MKNKIIFTMATLFALMLSGCGGGGGTSVDTQKPVITLSGANPMQLYVGDTFVDPGATATDDTDGDISSLIVVSGSVDTAVAQTYTLSYNVSDSTGNSADEQNRTVVVSSVPDTTLKLKVTNQANGVGINAATVKLYDANGTPINPSDTYATDPSGDVEITIDSDTRDVRIKTSKTGYVDQVGRVSLPHIATETPMTLHMLAVGSAGVNFTGNTATDPGGSGASVDITGALFTKADGSPVTPPLSVDITPLNPISSPNAFPGSPDIDMGGSPGVMVSSGMVDFTFRDADGDIVVLDTGTPVTITMPLYSVLDPTTGVVLVPGDSVPVWSMDSSTGEWKNEVNGTVVTCASPTGLCTQASVIHFSWWNTDFAISATGKDVVVIDNDTNSTLDETNVTSIKLTAKFTEAVSGSSNYHGPTAIRHTQIAAQDNIGVGNGFDVEFILEVAYNDGSMATKRYPYTWSEINAADSIEFRISKDDTYAYIALSAYDTKYSNYQTYPVYFAKTLIGLGDADIDTTINGIPNGDATVGTISCMADYGYCAYTKGTQTGDITITMQSKLDATVQSSLTIHVASFPELAIKTTYSWGSGSNESNATYYNSWGWYLSSYLLNNATFTPPLSYDITYRYISVHAEMVLDKDGTIDPADYTWTIECETASGAACPSDEEFATPFTFSSSDLPTTLNRSNKYYFKATKTTDPSVSTRLRVYYYSY